MVLATISRLGSIPNSNARTSEYKSAFTLKPLVSWVTPENNLDILNYGESISDARVRAVNKSIFAWARILRARRIYIRHQMAPYSRHIIYCIWKIIPALWPLEEIQLSTNKPESWYTHLKSRASSPHTSFARFIANIGIEIASPFWSLKHFLYNDDTENQQ
jgi:hypothetical protein